MCNKITKISTQSKFQWIGVCSHGSAHIFWRTARVCISVEKLDALMNKALAGKLPVERVANGYLLWLNDVAIKLSQKDYHEIEDLFAQGMKYSSMPFLQQKNTTEKSKPVLH